MQATLGYGNAIYRKCSHNIKVNGIRLYVLLWYVRTYVICACALHLAINIVQSSVLATGHVLRGHGSHRILEVVKAAEHQVNNIPLHSLCFFLSRLTVSFGNIDCTVNVDVKGRKWGVRLTRDGDDNDDVVRVSSTLQDRSQGISKQEQEGEKDA